MSLAVLSSCALQGLQAHRVQVEVHVGAGLPSFSLVGLPSAGVRESRERVRSAILNSGFTFPAGRITANLAPADLPKHSGRFDLPIALGILLASGQVADAQGQPPDLRDSVFCGELSLTGSLIASESALALAWSVAGHPPTRPGARPASLVMASEDARMAALVPNLSVYQASSLSEVVAHLRAAKPLQPADPVPLVQSRRTYPCLSDVRGQLTARLAVEVAAAGGHGLLMTGAPGVGKSMLAQRLVGLLPPLSVTQAIEVAAVRSLVRPREALDCGVPYRAPHHSASMAALVGGGIQAHPGEISLAHEGVLFLDELPEFDRRALEALREPLETGHITVSRASGSHQYPARFQLVAAMNPCPCGWHGQSREGRTCRCSDEQIRRYRARLSGPLMDRIDLHVKLSNDPSWGMAAPPGEPSSLVRARALAARERQWARQGCLNSRLEGKALRAHTALDAAGRQVLEDALARWNLSARSVHRILRVARTVADLKGEPAILREHVSQAMQYRHETQNPDAVPDGPARPQA